MSSMVENPLKRKVPTSDVVNSKKRKFQATDWPECLSVRVGDRTMLIMPLPETRMILGQYLFCWKEDLVHSFQQTSHMEKTENYKSLHQLLAFVKDVLPVNDNDTQDVSDKENESSSEEHEEDGNENEHGLMADQMDDQNQEDDITDSSQTPLVVKIENVHPGYDNDNSSLPENESQQSSNQSLYMEANDDHNLSDSTESQPIHIHPPYSDVFNIAPLVPEDYVDHDSKLDSITSTEVDVAVEFNGSSVDNMEYSPDSPSLQQEDISQLQGEGQRLESFGTRKGSTFQRRPPYKCTPELAVPGTSLDRSNGGATRNPRRKLSLEDMVYLIQEKESTNKSTRALAEQFNCGKTQVASILKKKQDYLSAYAAGHKRIRKITKMPHGELNSAIWEWLQQVIAANIPISGPFIRLNALKIAEEMNITDFKASSGWLGCFKARHNFSFAADRTCKISE